MTELRPDHLLPPTTSEQPESATDLGGVAVMEAVKEPGRPLNEIDRLIAGEFSDPALWQEPLRAHEPIFGLEYARDKWGSVDQSEQVEGPANKGWLALVYGFRIVPDPEATTPGAVKLETATLDTVHRIHERLNDTVLKGEGMRIAKPTIPPHPEEGLKNAENNDLWVELIRHHQWPIMKDAPVIKAQQDGSGDIWEKGVTTWNSHDYAAKHLGNSALYPREIQDLITEATIHEQARRKQYHAGEVNDKVLYLSVFEEGKENPYASYARGSGWHTDGITEIDHLTDADNYMDLLAYLVDEPQTAAEDRLATLQAYLKEKHDPYEYSHELGSAVSGVVELKKLVADILNFNNRHRDGENIVPEAVDQIMEQVLNGVVRVAKKIRGNYEYKPAA